MTHKAAAAVVRRAAPARQPSSTRRRRRSATPRSPRPLARLAEAIWHMLTRKQPFAPKGATDPPAA